jgi:hypothetical protein
MNPAEWSTARKAQLEVAAADEADAMMAAKPVVYRDIQFRSTLEANWARTLDGLSISWQYEPWLYHAPSGERYLPDFWLPRIRTFLEVKGLHMQRAHKPQQLAEGVRTDDVIVLIGFPPLRTSQSPYQWEAKLKWHDPLGYDTRLAQCPECSAWQWMRAQLSRHCRSCRAFHTGLLAKSGEMPFHFIEPQRPGWMRPRLCPGSASMISSPFTAR